MKALLGFDMVLPLRVRSQAGHPINEMILLCLWGRDILPRHPRACLGRRSVSLRVYCAFALESLIDCLTVDCYPISKNPCHDTQRLFYQVWKIPQHTQGILSGMQSKQANLPIYLLFFD